MTRRPVLVVLAILVAIGGLGVLAHRPLLRAAGHVLLVEDPPEWTDAIVVVAGSTPSREETAATLFRQGWAPRVLVSRQHVPGRVQRLIDLGIRRLDFQGESVAALEKYGVPREAIVVLDQPVEITEAELRVVAAVARERGWRRLTLVTTWWHSRRVQVIWDRETDGTIEARLATVPDQCNAGGDPWWRRRRCSEAVLHEYLGLLALYLRISTWMR
ncbi:MAG TPA: YdcF family protein [Methylomirabilota bacterium]|nr:YdcF family protein [Methylomirabilota bacterium]